MDGSCNLCVYTDTTSKPQFMVVEEEQGNCGQMRENADLRKKGFDTSM